MMNKDEFIKRMVVKYMSHIREDDEPQMLNAEQRKEDYDKFLDSKLDFDYLYEKVITEYKLKSLPEISWLKQHFKIAQSYKHYDSGLTYTVWMRTAFGDYPFAIDMKYPVPEIISAYRKLGMRYISDNRQETRIRYGLE